MRDRGEQLSADGVALPDRRWYGGRIGVGREGEAGTRSDKKHPNSFNWASPILSSVI